MSNRRIVFAIDGDTFHIGVIHDTHADWFDRLGIGKRFEKILRGYCEEQAIFVYRGSSFEFESKDEATLKRHLPTLKARLNWLNFNARVLVGKPQRFGGRPKDIGSVNDLMSEACNV